MTKANDAESDAACTIAHRGEILALLDRLERERVPTTAEFAGGHAIASRVLQVRRDSAALVFDVARDAETNRLLFASDAVAFVTELDGVQIAFATGKPAPVAIPDGPAALVALPATLTRLQRREWFRAALPVQPPVRCTLLDERGNASPGRAIDLSAGGVGVVVDGPFADADLQCDHELIVSLPDVGRIDLKATLRSVAPAGAAPKGGGLRLGFRFERLPGETANRIQRYVQRIEVEQLRILRLRNRAA